VVCLLHLKIEDLKKSQLPRLLRHDTTQSHAPQERPTDISDLCYPYIMNEEDSVDIDTQQDLDKAQAVMGKMLEQMS